MAATYFKSIDFLTYGRKGSIFNSKSVTAITIFIYILTLYGSCAFDDNYEGYFFGNFTELWFDNQQNFRLKFEEINADSSQAINADSSQISKIYFCVNKRHGARTGRIQLYFDVQSRTYLSSFKIIVIADGIRYEPSATLADLSSCIGWYQISSERARVEINIERIGNTRRPFPNISLTNAILRDLSYCGDIHNSSISADESMEVIRRFIEEAGSTVNVTKGKNLKYILSLAENRKIRLFEGDYDTSEGPLELSGINNVIVEGVPKATIIGNNNDVGLFWLNGNNISLSNLTFEQSKGGIFLENCSNFNILNSIIKSVEYQDCVSIKSSNNISLINTCIKSNGINSIGIELDNSNNCAISDNGINVKGYLFYLWPFSKNNTINDRNTGKISDNGEEINETDGAFSNETFNSQANFQSNANNTWRRGKFHVC